MTCQSSTPFIQHSVYERYVNNCSLITGTECTGWAKKTGPFLNVDNFAMVSDRKASDMSKVCKFCLEKSIKLA